MGSVPNSSSTLAGNGTSVSTHTHLAGGPVRERPFPELAIACELKADCIPITKALRPIIKALR